jgi:urease accessory protein
MSCTFTLRRVAPCALAVAVLAAQSSSAFAHVGDHGAGLIAGLAHPFSGLDHILAMVAVGLWASQLGRPAAWLLPLAFPVMMVFGAVVGLSGVALPAVELAIAASVIVLGLVIALALRPSLAASAAIVAVFAVLHGYSHGAELPASASALAYGAGFVTATGMLHAAGLLLGAWPRGWLVPRAAGAAIAVVGVALLLTA